MFLLRGGVLSTKKEMRRTKRAVAKLPPSAELIFTCEMMLEVSYHYRKGSQGVSFA
jgi:hypothetical protein